MEQKVWLKGKVSKENSKKVHKYKIDKDLPNLDVALDEILDKFFERREK